MKISFLINDFWDEILNYYRLLDGATPLLLACQSRWEYAVMELLNRGANPNIHTTDEDFVLPLHSAVQFFPDEEGVNQ